MTAFERTKDVLQSFAPRVSVNQVEEGRQLSPRFDRDGLIVAVTTDAASGEVLMVGAMNAEALVLSIETGEAHYWSRSRGCLWHKGATSGLIQRIVEMRIDDDQDAIWLRVAVQGNGASCHVGYRSCFYRFVALGPLSTGHERLHYTESHKVFDPAAVYGTASNPSRL